MIARHRIAVRHTRFRRVIVIAAAVAAVGTTYTAASASTPNRQPMRANQCGIAPNGVLGITADGHIGCYDRDGQWDPATAVEISGIGPTEGTHLPLLG